MATWEDTIRKQEAIVEYLLEIASNESAAKRIISSLAYDLTPEELIDWAERNEYTPWDETEEEDDNG